jgi:hypothetical protein
VFVALPKRHGNVPNVVMKEPRNGVDGDMKNTVIGVGLAKAVSRFHDAPMTVQLK